MATGSEGGEEEEETWVACSRQNDFRVKGDGHTQWTLQGEAGREERRRGRGRGGGGGGGGEGHTQWKVYLVTHWLTVPHFWTQPLANAAGQRRQRRQLGGSGRECYYKQVML